MISALDWGLGHATRCVPLIRELEKKNQILLGVTPSTEKIFQEEFPHLKKIQFPCYDISYSATFPLWTKLALQWRKINKVIEQEKQLLEKLIVNEKIEVVISDNRFGLYSNSAHCIFITHQVFLKTPFLNSFLQNINKKHILRFQELWIPDHENDQDSLSGTLSHGKQFHPKIKFIGPLSRLTKIDANKKFDCLFLLSGPEPQHSILGELLLKKAQLYPEKKFALASPSYFNKQNSNVNFFKSPSSNALSELIASSDKIICRSGYSTLMDMDRMNKKDLFLVPTPGQTEQEYLAQFWKEKKGAKVCLQKELMEINLF